MKHYCHFCKNAIGGWPYDSLRCSITNLPVKCDKGRKCKNFKDDGSKLRKSYLK